MDKKKKPLDEHDIEALKEVDRLAPAAPLAPRCDDPKCEACAGAPGTKPHVGVP